MNKNELAATLELSLGTISRYTSMGMPYARVGRILNFDIDEVGAWISDNIDSRSPGQHDSERPSTKEIASWALGFAEKLLYYVKTCKHCNGAIKRDAQSGKFGGKR